MMSDVRVVHGDHPAALRSSPNLSVSAEVAQLSPNPTAHAPLLIRGDARALPLPDDSVDLIVTSPPYLGLRSYTDGGEHYAGQLGAEATAREFIAALIECTREMVRVLKPSGSIFLNLGDKYAQNTERSRNGLNGKLGGGKPLRDASDTVTSARRDNGVRTKSLMLLPERYRIAAVDELFLIARAVLVWSKPNGLPESVQDRVRRSHEDWVHLTKSPKYYAAVDEIREPYSENTHARRKDGGGTRWAAELVGQGSRRDAGLGGKANADHPLGKLPGSVWEIASQPLRVPAELGIDHFAAFPMEWPRRLILGWSPPGGVVLDPFSGTGTTALVASALGRQGISVDLSADYCRLARWRVNDPGQRTRATRPAKRKSTPDDTQEDDDMSQDSRTDQEATIVALRKNIAALEDTVAALGAALSRAEERLEAAKRTAWVAVPVEAETIAAGDTIAAKNGELRNVQWVSRQPGHDAPDGKLKIMTQSGIYAAATVHVRPDYLVPVLRRPTADALDILSRQLGAQATT